MENRVRGRAPSSCCAAFCAFFEPASRISQTCRGCASYSSRRACTGSIHLIRLSAISLLAIDAADARGAAAFVRPRDRLRRRKQFVPVEDRADSGCPGRCGACAAGRSSCCGLSCEFRPAIAQRDGVAVALGHSPAVGPGNARRFGQQVPRLAQAPAYMRNLAMLASAVQESFRRRLRAARFANRGQFNPL